jgi:hypothetical protein
MRRWFLSYHSPDGALADRLKAAVERKDVGSRVFLAATSLRAGGYWQPGLAKEADEADAFVLLVGEKGLGPWQALEYYVAHDKHVKSPEFPVVLMLIDGQTAPGLPFLRQLHWIVSADPASEKDVARLSVPRPVPRRGRARCGAMRCPIAACPPWRRRTPTIFSGEGTRS